MVKLSQTYYNSGSKLLNQLHFCTKAKFFQGYTCSCGHSLDYEWCLFSGEVCHASKKKKARKSILALLGTLRLC